jgi:signal peptidase II
MKSIGRGKAAWAGSIVTVVVALDQLTKQIVQKGMELHDRIEILGDAIRLTYIRNPGAAFGIHAGPNSRWIFLGISIIALGILAALYRVTPVADRLRLTSIALIAGGAIGNIIDRLMSSAGVVDFVDVGLGDLRWPVFNVADMAVTTGALVLAVSLWREDRRLEVRAGE